MVQLPLAAGTSGRLKSAKRTTLGRSAAQNSLPGSAFTLSDRRSDSYSALRACGGSHQVLRTSPSGPLRGAGKHLPSVVQACGQATPVSRPQQSASGLLGPPSEIPAETRLPAPLSVSGARASPPTSFFRTCRLRLLLVRKNSSAPPPGCRLDRGLRPPLNRLPAASRCAPACVRAQLSGSPVLLAQPKPAFLGAFKFILYTTHQQPSIKEFSCVSSSFSCCPSPCCSRSSPQPYRLAVDVLKEGL